RYWRPSGSPLANPSALVEQREEERLCRARVDRSSVVEGLLLATAHHGDAELLGPRLLRLVDPLRHAGHRRSFRRSHLPCSGEAAERPVLRAPIDARVFPIQQRFVVVTDLVIRGPWVDDEVLTHGEDRLS